MDAEEYLCREWNCKPEDLELVHLATFQALAEHFGLDTKEGLDALVIANDFARRAAQHARREED